MSDWGLGQTFCFSDFLVENPDACEYAVRFDFGVFCCHPDRRSFEKTDPIMCKTRFPRIS